MKKETPEVINKEYNVYSKTVKNHNLNVTNNPKQNTI